METEKTKEFKVSDEYTDLVTDTAVVYSSEKGKEETQVPGILKNRLSDRLSDKIMREIVLFVKRRHKGVWVSELMESVVIESRSVHDTKVTLHKNKLSDFDHRTVVAIIDKALSSGYLEKRSSFLFFKSNTPWVENFTPFQ